MLDESSPTRLWKNAHFHIYLSAALVTAGEIFLKIGADQSAHIPSRWSWLGLNGASSPWIWLGMTSILASLFSWLYALRTVPLNVAYLLSNIVHVTVPISCWIFLHETISTRRWAGIALVLLGVTLVAKPLAKLEDRL